MELSLGEAPKSEQNVELLNEINKLKKEIECDPDGWDHAKKFTNKYERVHVFRSSKLAPSIAKIQPVSRSFFKLVEISEKFKYQFKKPIRSLHLAEAPGGFIQQWNWIRKFQGFQDEIHAMSLISDKTGIPTWKKLKEILNNQSNVIFHDGIDGTGDILKYDNRKQLYDMFNGGDVNGGCDFVTGDGGFDFTNDFQHMESDVFPLIVAQTLIGLKVLNKGGIFITKMFDITTRPMIQLLQILKNCFEKVSLLKPSMSRQANSEKYFVGINYRGCDGFFIKDKLFQILEMCCKQRGGIYVRSLLNDKINIPTEFQDGILGRLNKLMIQQKQSLKETLELLEIKQKNPIQQIGITKKLSDKQIIDAKKWCRTQNIAINEKQIENWRESGWS